MVPSPLALFPPVQSHHYSSPGIIINKIKTGLHPAGGAETEMVAQNGGWSRPHSAKRGREYTGGVAGAGQTMAISVTSRI